MVDAQWVQMLPRPVRKLPADLAAVLLLTGVTLVVTLTPVIRETPLRVVFGLPFVLVLPGYALVAALFPEAGDGHTSEEAEENGAGDESGRGSGVDGVERVALSFGLSIAVVPLVGLVLNFTPFGIRLVPVLVSVSLVTAGGAVVAARRRRLLPAEERFRVPYQGWYAGARAELFEPDSGTDAALNVLLVVSILLAVSSVGYAVAVPSQGESFTEFYLLTEDENSDLVAADYPTEFVAGEGRELVIGVGNQEHEAVTYTVVVQLQQVEFDPPDEQTNGSAAANVTTVRVRETETLGQFETQLAHNETMTRQYTVRPTLVGENMRLAFLLYRGSSPPEPTVDNAYRETHLWVNVTAG